MILRTSHRPQGFTLIELIGVVVAIAVVATVALQIVRKVVTDAKYQGAKQEMRIIGFAITGNTASPGDCGYIGDTRRLPRVLEDLVVEPDSVCGWSGPYIETYDGTDDWKTDPWGRTYVYQDGVLTLKSVGGPEQIVYNYAESYRKLLDNKRMITLADDNGNYLTDTDVRVFIEDGGCGNPEFSYTGYGQWEVAGLSKCVGDIYMITLANDTVFTASSHGNITAVTQPLESLNFGVIQYTGECAVVSGREKNQVSFQLKNTGSQEIRVTGATLNWDQSSACWAGLTPYLESISLADGTVVWDYQSEGHGYRAFSGTKLTFRDPVNLPPYSTSGPVGFDNMVFDGRRSGPGYSVNMQGTRFKLRLYASNTTQQTVYFNTCNNCVPGQIKYIQGSLITTPWNGNTQPPDVSECSSAIYSSTYLLAGQQVRYVSAADTKLGQDNQRQTDFFRIHVDGAQKKVSVNTVAGQSSAWVSFKKPGTVKNSQGFSITYIGQDNTDFSFAVTSINAPVPLENCTFDFGTSAQIQSPGDEATVIISRITDANKDGKITICHFPPGNPDNPQTITISTTAWLSHMIHGDRCEPCDESTTNGNYCTVYNFGFSLLNPYPADLPVFVNAVKVNWWNYQSAGSRMTQDECVDTDGDGKITICHYPPGNPENAQTMVIGKNAWLSHRDHGDRCGPCDQESNTDTTDQVFLEELILNDRTLWNDAQNRLASGSTVSLLPTDLMVIYPQSTVPGNFMNGFYSEKSGGERVNMKGAFVELTFFGLDGTPYPIRFQIPNCE